MIRFSIVPMQSILSRLLGGYLRLSAILVLGILASRPAYAATDNKVDMGPWHMAALIGDTLSMSGKNDGGYFGNGNTTSSLSPIVVSTGWRHVVLGSWMGFAIKRDSSLWAWGCGGCYLGTGDLNDQISAVRIGSAKWITVIGTGSDGSGGAGIQADSTLWAWGENARGEAGPGGMNILSPMKIGTDRWLDVSVGNGHSLGIRADSTLWAWGWNGWGQLGTGDSTDTATPVQVGSAKWIRIEAGDAMSFAIRSDSTLWSWGRGDYYDVGDEVDILSGLGYPGPSKSTPTQIGSQKWIHVSVSRQSGGGIRADSTLWTWGDNQSGQLGIGNYVYSSTPVHVGILKWKYFAIENSSAIGMTQDRTFYSWGQEFSGRLGLGGGFSPNVPTAITVPGTWPAPQTLTFASLSEAHLGDADFSPGATASSGLTVSYASSNAAVATVVGNQIHIIGVGTTTLTAMQAGDAHYESANPISRTLTVGRTAQSITFPALSDKTFGDVDFAPVATVGSGLPVNYAISDTTVAIIVSGQIRIVGAGTATITASQAGNGIYNAAADVQRSFTIGKAPQSITFGALAAKVLGDSAFSLGATAGSGLAAAYASSNPAVATVSGSMVTLVGAGTSTLTASQSGNGNYLAATDVGQTLTVNKRSQSITFATLPEKVFGDSDFTPSATAGSGLSVSYTSSDTTVVAMVSGRFHIVGAGTATITAAQAGNGIYLTAADVQRNLTVGKAMQSITFGTLPAKTFGDSAFSLGATASSGLPVTYVSSNPAVATISGAMVALVAAGTTTVTASQAGDANRLPASAVAQVLTVAQAGHTVAFLLGADTLKTEGDPAFRLAANSSVGLPVVFTSSDTAVAQVFGDSVRVGRVGSADLVAHQDGDARFAAAAPVSRTVRVRMAVPTAIALENMVPRGVEVDTSVRLFWPRNPKADRYHLQVTLDTTGSGLLDRDGADTTFLLGGLPFGAKVYWRAAPLNTTGQAPYSPYAAFQVRPPPPGPIDISRIPALPSGGTATTVELSWPAMDLATGYRFQVCIDSNLAPRLDTMLIRSVLTLADLAPGSAQLWRVAAVNGVSEGPFTPWLTFRVSAKDGIGLSRGVAIDSVKPVQVTEVVAVATRDGTTRGLSISLTEDKRPPAGLPSGFLPMTGNINLEANMVGSTRVDDSLIIITLTPPDTALNGARIDVKDRPMVYTLDSATGLLDVVYDLVRDSSGRILLPLSKGKKFLLGVDTVAPVVKDGTPLETQKTGSRPIISGQVEDNIRNCRTVLYYRKGGERTFDSIPVAVDAAGRFEAPLDLLLDGTGFEYHLKATDGRNMKATFAKDIPVKVTAILAADSLPSMQWRLFALPTLPQGARWDELAAYLGVYGSDWKLYSRAAEGLRESGVELEEAQAGTAYWLKSRRGFLPSVPEGIAAPVSRPFERVLPPRSWISFGNPFLFPVAWQSVVDSTQAAPGALVGPYTYRDSSWIAPVEIPALIPWEGYYAYNASDDTLRMRIPAFRAKDAQSPLAQAAFHLEWQVRGEADKATGNLFGGLPANSRGGPSQAKSTATAGGYTVGARAYWQAPRPESPEEGLHAGFLPQGGAPGLLQTDFRTLDATGGLAWTTWLTGLLPGKTYVNRLQGLSTLPQGMAVALADPATGSFMTWSDGLTYNVEAQAGEPARELRFYAGSPLYLQALGASFTAEHPVSIELGNYPNPVRGFTEVHFAVPASAATEPLVRLTIRDMQGRLIKVLAMGPRPIGRYSMRWDARDAQGREVATGVYRLMLEVGGKKMNRFLQILK